MEVGDLVKVCILRSEHLAIIKNVLQRPNTRGFVEKPDDFAYEVTAICSLPGERVFLSATPQYGKFECPRKVFECEVEMFE
jgi:hypothetical protein